MDVSGIECIALTSAIESNLGQVESRELLPSYHMTFEQSAVEQNNIDSYRDVS
ncbi:MAG: DUF2997 domain-containing protein [Pseudanabaena sp.]